MTQNKERLKLMLKKADSSLTKPRLLIFQAMLGQEPLTMSELIQRLKGSVDRASAYRAIHIFEEVGIVQRLYSGWKYKIELTDSFSDHHHHLTCSNCRKIIQINEKGLEKFIDKLASSYGFKANGHQLEIQGLCSSCL